jgi:RNA polymerase sigma-70 factor (ECF subfamily)
VDVLIDRIRRGDPRAFSRLVAEIEPFVSGSSLKVCRDRDVASENAQDTFINVYRKLHQFDGTSKFTTWLYSIIVNNCRMKRRRRLLEKDTVSTDDIAEEQIDAAQKSESSAYGADRKLLLDELQTVLGSAVETLPQEYRSVFVLRDLENHTTEETAHMLGLSIAAVKSRLHRARARVREHLELYLTVGE